VSARIYIEGAGDSKELHARCREGFRKLFEKCGFVLRMPKLIASGGRGEAFEDFKTAHAQGSPADYIALLIDSETPLETLDAAWDHLTAHDHWPRPSSAGDDQVLFMTTCMETWIVADHEALAGHYRHMLQRSALPSLVDLERRPRDEVQDCLARATSRCSNAYLKGRRSFAVLGTLDPEVLGTHLPSFSRVRRILASKL